MKRRTVGRIEAEFRRYERLGWAALEQLGEGLWAEAPPGGLSAATLAWHIAGNLASRFTDFGTSDGEKPWRRREDEFAPRAVGRAELEATWTRGWQALFGALEDLDDDALDREVTIRGVGLHVEEALLRSLAHVSYHVGQIVYVAKGLRGADWRSLSIPPGGTAAYNRNPTLEKPSGPDRA